MPIGVDDLGLASILAWVWKEFGKTIVDKTSKAAWERVRWVDKAMVYSEEVQKDHGTMRVLGHSRPVSVEGIYTAINMFDPPTTSKRHTIQQLQAAFAGQDSPYDHAPAGVKRLDGLDMVKSGQNLFILGKPGAGKTTFLKHVALLGARGDLGRVPVFVSLKQLSDSGLSVFDFVVREFKILGFPNAAAYVDRLLGAGKAILLFDGLDEVDVADNERRHLITDVENFTREYDQCQGLITCRPSDNKYNLYRR